MSGRRDDEFTDYVTERMWWLRRLAHLLCQDWQHADDLVQATITRLYTHWGRAAAVEHPDAYVRTILVREYLSERRSGWARRVSLTAEPPDSADVLGDREGALDLRAALAGLPPRQRATLVLRFYCDLNVDQAAELLGCSPGTVKSQTAKGIGALRRALQPEHGPGNFKSGQTAWRCSRMDETGVRTLLQRVADDPAPPSRVDITAARQRGRRRIRRRRAALAAAPVAAAAAVTLVVSGVIPASLGFGRGGLQSGPQAPRSRASR